MYLTQLLVVMVISSILISEGRFNTAKLLRHYKNKEDSIKLEKIKEATLNYYNDKHTLPGNIDDIKSYISQSSFMSANTYTDQHKESFVIINPGTMFGYKGSDKNYQMAIVGKGENKTIDLSITDDDDIVDAGDDTFLLISRYDILNTSLEKTKTKVSMCSSAVELYKNDKGSNPDSVFTLTGSGYLSPENAYDNYGSILSLDDNKSFCYSFGKNREDNNASNDDIL